AVGGSFGRATQLGCEGPVAVYDSVEGSRNGGVQGVRVLGQLCGEVSLLEGDERPEQFRVARRRRNLSCALHSFLPGDMKFELALLTVRQAVRARRWIFPTAVIRPRSTNRRDF